MTNATLTQFERAERLLKELFADRERVLVSDVKTAAQAAGVGFGTVAKARHQLGIEYVKNGPFPAYWGKPVQGQP